MSRDPNVSGTIIKRDAVARAGGPEGEAPPDARWVRIPASQVHADPEAYAAGEGEETFRLHRILRRGETPVSVALYQMADLALEPDFPLSDASAAGDASQTAERDAGPALDPDLEAAWRLRLEEAVGNARAEAYEEGYEQGYVAAEAVLQASFDQRKGDLEKDVARLHEAWKAFLKKNEPMMASLAFEVARQLLDAPLPQDVRAVSAQALAQALDQFGDDTPLEITLHPDDHARLQAYGLTDDLDALHSSIRWHADESIPMGDWIVQSPDSAIRRLKDELLGHLKNRLGLLAVMKARDA